MSSLWEPLLSTPDAITFSDIDCRFLVFPFWPCTATEYDGGCNEHRKILGMRENRRGAFLLSDPCIKTYYRPQRSCDKLIFSQASVSHSVHRGCLAHPRADTPRADTPCPVHAGISPTCPEHAGIHTPGGHCSGRNALLFPIRTFLCKRVPLAIPTNFVCYAITGNHHRYIPSWLGNGLDCIKKHCWRCQWTK